jgi:hypothetical protein
VKFILVTLQFLKGSKHLATFVTFQSAQACLTVCGIRCVLALEHLCPKVVANFVKAPVAPCLVGYLHIIRRSV